MLDYLEQKYPELAEWLARTPISRKEDPQHSAKRYDISTEVNGSPRITAIDTDFLSSAEFRDLMALKDAFAAFGPPPYTMNIGPDTFTAQTYQEVLKLALDDAQKGVAVQRYKGLGEMNADQLFDTTMDPSHRTLLQVKVKDLVEADKNFTLLMGDEVEPRRAFIEREALNVTNLDV